MTKFKDCLEKLQDSEEFKEFKEEHPEAYLASGFFVADYKGNNNQEQLDYFLPDKRIASFKFVDNGEEEKIQLQISEQKAKKEMQELEKEPGTNLEELKDVVKEKLDEENIDEKLKEIIAVVYMLDGELIWNLQCLLPGMKFFNIQIRDKDKSIKKFKEHSIQDMVKIK